MQPAGANKDQAFWVFFTNPRQESFAFVNFPTVNDKIPLLLIRIYFDSDYITDLDKIINFFELSAKEILLISTQLITKNQNHDQNSVLIEAIDVGILQHLDIKQTTLITEVLNSFDQILKSTTLDLWQANYSRLCQNRSFTQTKSQPRRKEENISHSYDSQSLK